LFVWFSQDQLEFMAYLHAGANYYTLPAIIKFTNKCNAGKLNKDSYADEPTHVIEEKIKFCREASIAAIQAGVAGIIQQQQFPKRTIEDIDNDKSMEWERRVKASMERLEQCVGATETALQVAHIVFIHLTKKKLTP